MLNVIILMGRLTRDPECRILATKENASVTNFDLAVDNVRKEADGTRGSSFFQVTCFGNLANNVAKYTRKGSKVIVTGSIQQRNYTAKDGSKRYVYDVVADSVEFLDPKQESPEVDHIDEVIEELAATEVEVNEPRFDPMTGKPLKPAKK